MLREGKQKSLEIPNARDLIPEILRLRKLTRRKCEYEKECKKTRDEPWH